MEESYVSFEIAKLLKEKGFDEPCVKFFWKLGTRFKESMDKDCPNNSDLNYIFKESYSAPTQQMAMDWIRTNYKIHISPYFTNIGWHYEIFDLTRCDITGCEPFYRVGIPSQEQVKEKCEEAIEDAIKHVLEHLI